MSDEKQQDIHNTASNQGAQGTFHGDVSFDNRRNIRINAAPNLGAFLHSYGSVLLLLAIMNGTAWWVLPPLQHRYLLPEWTLLAFMVLSTALVLVSWPNRIAPAWQGHSRWWAMYELTYAIIRVRGRSIR